MSVRTIRRRRTQSGAAAVEFGLIAGTVLLPLLLGVVQYGWYFYVSQSTGGAATHVARRLAVGDCWASGEALTFVKNEVASDKNLTTLTMTPTTNAAAEVGVTQLTVTVTSDGDLIGFVPMPDGGTITRSVSTVIEDTNSSGSC
jgi:Flp pilus assembly protein TadG